VFKFTPIALVLLITTAINLFVFYRGWQSRKTRSGLYFALGLLGVTFWTLSAGLDYAAVPIPLKVFFAQLENTSYNGALIFLVLFVLSYTGREALLKNTWGLALLIGLPILNILLAWTNDLHHLLWSGFVPSTIGDNTLIFQHGPAFVWTALTDYLMTALIIVPLAQASRSGAELSQRQARLLLASILVPLAFNLIYILQGDKAEGVDWTSLTFSASGILILWALYGTRLLDLVPIARDKLIGSLSDGMIVLDLQNRIIDVNQSAAQMIDSLPTTLIGQDLAQVMPLTHSFLEQAPEQEIKTELEVGTAPKRYFDVLLSPLLENRQRVVGRLLIFRDITERKQIDTERAAWAGVLQATFDSSSAGILVLDTNGQTVLANKQVAKIWPTTQMQPVINSNHPFLTAVQPFIQNFAEVTEFVETLRQQPAEEGVLRMALWDKRIFDVHIAPYYIGKEITGQVWTFENVTKRIEADKAEVLVEERRRISQETHDGLLQGLVGMRFQLKQWHKLVDEDPPRLHPKVDELHTFLTDSIDEMRRFIFALRPAPLDPGFFEAVRQLAIGMQRYYQLTVEIEIRGPESRLHRDWEQALFRVVQEALSNIGKHAHATQAWVEIDLSDSQTLTLTIRDNGRGLDSSSAPGPLHGYGLGNMADRLKSLGGQLTVEGQPNQGTTVRATVPYNTPG